MKTSMIFVALLMIGAVWAQTCFKNETCFGMMQDMRVEEIKHNILRELGLRSPPQLDKSKMPSEAMLLEYQRMAEEELLQIEESEGIEGVLIQAEDPSSGEDLATLVAMFNLGGQESKFYELHDAKLTFYVRLDQPTGRQKVNIQVYDWINGVMGDLIATDQQVISGSKRVTVKLARDEVARWFESESQIKKVFVAAFVDGLNMAIHPQQTRNDHENMILQMSIKPKTRKRRETRAVCDPNGPDKGCCLYDLMIDFQKIGWDWIVTPRSYNAYICRGSCSGATSSSYKFVDFGHHKIVKSADRMGQATADLIQKSQSCCHPTGYDAIRVVYLNTDNRVQSVSVNGMVATRCACS